MFFMIAGLLVGAFIVATTEGDTAKGVVNWWNTLA